MRKRISKRRNTTAKALRSPALRQRVVQSKKRKAADDWADDYLKLMANNWHGIDRF